MISGCWCWREAGGKEALPEEARPKGRLIDQMRGGAMFAIGCVKRRFFVRKIIGPEKFSAKIFLCGRGVGSAIC